jgi:transcriptional regulator with XRE-family HTH domain
LSHNRKVYGLSQVALAVKSGVSLPTIQNIEAGKSNPSLDVIEKLGAALGFLILFEQKEPEWSLLSDHGLPLLDNFNTHQNNMSDRIQFVNELLLACVWISEKSNCEREREALQALVVAIRDHYSTFYNKNLAHSKSVQQLSHLPMTGRVIKLRRIAIASLSRWL